MLVEPAIGHISFEEFLRVCTDSDLINEDSARQMHKFARALGGVGSVPRVSGDNTEKLQSFESILSFDYPDYMTFDSYITTEENYYTCEILRTVAFIPRIWKAISPVFIHAPTGQGKTHLLAATMNATSRKALLINTLDLETEYQHSKSAGRERELRNWMISHHLILIDDIQFARGNRSFEKFIISVMNRMPRESHGIVISSDVEPSMLTGLDASLFSRLMSGITIKLEIVNKKGRREILEQFFNYTGMNLSDDVVDYLADTFTTNVRQLKAAARMVLARVLGTGKAMTVESTKALLGFMTERIRQETPPLQSDNIMPPIEIDKSEYIVVEVEEEPSRKQSGSGKAPFVIEPVKPVPAVPRASSRRAAQAPVRAQKYANRVAVQQQETIPQAAVQEAAAKVDAPAGSDASPAPKERKAVPAGRVQVEEPAPEAKAVPDVPPAPEATAAVVENAPPVETQPASAVNVAEDQDFPEPVAATSSPGTRGGGQAEKSAAARSSSRSAKKFKDMLASADTVEKQTEALRMAVSERIRQLMESGANDIDIGKLQVTLKFLEKGDMEAAMLSLKA